MNVESHKRALAIVHLVVGIFKIFVYGGVSVFFSTFIPFIKDKAAESDGADAIWVFDLMQGAFFTIIIAAALFTAIPSIIGGFATLKNKEWGMILLLIAGCVSLLSFPIGTAIGAYTIWVYIENNKAKKNAETS